MKKYWTVFIVSWQNGFVYRLNFILWRLRSIIVILTVYFLWEAVFRNGGVIFGYTKAKILTYVFLTLVLRAVILGARSMDVAGEIAEGQLANYLLKPISYHLFWFSRDLADKLLNILFSVIEITFLYWLLQPPIFLQTNPLYLLSFVVALILAVILNFQLGFIASNFSFWTPGNSWGFWFVYLVLQDFLGGVLFPLDIFPKPIYNILISSPFPYLLYFPANLFLGKIPFSEIGRDFVVVIFWLFASLWLIKKEWSLGIKSYAAEGR